MLEKEGGHGDLKVSGLNVTELLFTEVEKMAGCLRLGWEMLAEIKCEHFLRSDLQQSLNRDPDACGLWRGYVQGSLGRPLPGNVTEAGCAFEGEQLG